MQHRKNLAGYSTLEVCVCYHVYFLLHMPTVNILVILEGNARYSRERGGGLVLDSVKLSLQTPPKRGSHCKS
jgi:hypothetical protein